jgi:hypothetical protein
MDPTAASGPFWHGGAAIAGNLLVHPADSGLPVTTERGLAEMYAATAEGTAWIYEVEPIGPLEPVPPLIAGSPTVSYRCGSARVLRRYTVSAERRQRLQQALARVVAEIGEGDRHAD